MRRGTGPCSARKVVSSQFTQAFDLFEYTRIYLHYINGQFQYCCWVEIGTIEHPDQDFLGKH